MIHNEGGILTTSHCCCWTSRISIYSEPFLTNLRAFTHWSVPWPNSHFCHLHPMFGRQVVSGNKWWVSGSFPPAPFEPTDSRLFFISKPLKGEVRCIILSASVWVNRLDRAWRFLRGFSFWVSGASCPLLLAKITTENIGFAFNIAKFVLKCFM